MPSSTASFTMPTGSSSLARACANGVCSRHPLDPATKGKHHPDDPQRRAARWPTSDRNPGRLRIGTGGRLRIGMHGRLRRNPHIEGWFSDNWSWKWIFWDTALLTPLMLICVHFGMPRQPTNRELLTTADWWG